MPGSSTPTCPLHDSIESLGAAPPPLDGAGGGGGGSVPDEGLGTFLSRLLDTTGFYPRWECGAWSAQVGWLHIASDIAIFLAYAAIPTALLYFMRKRGDVPLRGIIVLFAAFILSCGITHALDASMFYRPAYRLLGVMKLITATVSTVTVVALVRAMPAALGIPGRMRAQDSEIQRREKAEAEVRALNLALQNRNSQLTVRSRRIDQAMELARVGMVRWNAKTGVIEWEVGLREALRGDADAPPPPSLHVERWADILDTPELTALLVASQEAVETGNPMAFEVPLSLLFGPNIRIRLSAARERGGEDPIMMGFARIIDSRVVERKGT